MAASKFPSTSASTPILPISQPLLSSPAARVFLSKVSEGVKNAMYHRRPWLELVDHKAFSKPESLVEVTSRIRRNWTYFRINYVIMLCSVVAFSLLSHLVSLFLLLVLLGGWSFLYFFRTEPLVLYGRRFSEREILGILLVLSIVIVFLTDVGSVLISSLMFGMAIICVHGAFRAPEDLFLEEQSATAGFMSFTANVPVQPAVATYV